MSHPAQVWLCLAHLPRVPPGAAGNWLCFAQSALRRLGGSARPPEKLGSFGAFAARPTSLGPRPARPRREIGFVSPKPCACPINHNSLPGKHLTLSTLWRNWLCLAQSAPANWVCLYNRPPVARRPRLALLHTSHFTPQTSNFSQLALFRIFCPAGPALPKGAELGLFPIISPRPRRVGSWKLGLFCTVRPMRDISLL
jgi:hypothetical protein